MSEIKEEIENILKSEFQNFKKEIFKNLTEEELKKEKEYFNKKKTEKEQYHKNIICSNCMRANFPGERYICCECENYNLCEKCEELRCQKAFNHNINHVFLRIKKPIDLDINKYDNIIKGTHQNLKIKKGQKIIGKITLINSGEKNLKDCFLSPICFEECYLTGPKIIIDDDLERNCSTDLEIEINDPIKKNSKDNENNQNKNRQYISCWRMFTKEGIPFGNVVYFYIEDLVENKN